MKNWLWVFVLALAMTIGCAGTLFRFQDSYRQDLPGQYGKIDYRTDSGIDYMYDFLAPYGNWLNLEPFGYVWTPRHTGYRWRPYTDGNWINTDDGWTWIANEPWGSIPYHYGRWGFDSGFGWFWVPGTEWSPAWVSWRWSNSYVGWAPLPPEVGFHSGRGYSSQRFDIPNHSWVFLQLPRFLDRELNRYTLPFERNLTIINITTIHNNLQYRNNRIFNKGIGIDVIRRVIKREVPRYTIREADRHRPASFVGHDVQIFRPTFQVHTNQSPKRVLPRDQAQRELTEARVFEPRQQASLSVQQSNVRRRQASEIDLLKKTQAADLKNFQRKKTSELAQMPNTMKKEQIRNQYQQDKHELQKRHQSEKNALTLRHKQDVEQVKRVVKRK